jgi:oligogalacturonide lyase
MSSAPKIEPGAKGKGYPDQRKRMRDSLTGRTVWQMTDTPGRITRGQYATQNLATADGEWIIYGSDRGNAPGRLDLFRMSLRTGESDQLTHSAFGTNPQWAHLSADGQEVFYIEDTNHFRAVNIHTLEERSLGRVEHCTRPHQLTVSPDNRFIADALFLENKEEEDFLTKPFGFLIRSAIVVIDTKTAAQHRLLDGNTPRTHVAYCPTNPNLLCYCHGGPWWYVQRLWLIHADGTGNRPIFPQTNFEGAGHEFWGNSGERLYVVCNGGRQPQGLWSVDVRTGEERCVLAGGCTGHATVNGAEDRFVMNELYRDSEVGLWLAKKGSPHPELLCRAGKGGHAIPPGQGGSAHARFLPDGKRVAFSSAITGSGELYIVEI